MRAVFIADSVDRDAGLLGDYLTKSRASIRYIDREQMADESVDADVVILLGSNRSAHHESQTDIVATEAALIRHTLANGTPVIGICYGAQVLARALGGDSHRGAQPECGWTPVDSFDEELCPPGPWGQMHHDAISAPPTATVIGSSPAGVQAFIDESEGARAVGWQFHPELTIETFRRWLAHHYSGSEDADPRRMLDEANRHAEATRPRAAALFDRAFRYLGVPQQADAFADELHLARELDSAGLGAPSDVVRRTSPGRSSSPPVSGGTGSHPHPPTEAICVLGYDSRMDGQTPEWSPTTGVALTLFQREHDDRN